MQPPAPTYRAALLRAALFVCATASLPVLNLLTDRPAARADGPSQYAVEGFYGYDHIENVNGVDKCIWYWNGDWCVAGAANQTCAPIPTLWHYLIARNNADAQGNCSGTLVIDGNSTKIYHKRTIVN